MTVSLPVAFGDVVTFTFVVTNQGTTVAAANTVTVTDFLPAGLTPIDN